MFKNRRVRNPQSFGALFETHVDAVYEAAWLVLRDRDLAAEVTRDTFVDAWTEARSVPADMADMWVLARARDRAFDWVRTHDPTRHTADPPPPATPPTPLGVLLRAQLVRDLTSHGIPAGSSTRPPSVPPPAAAPAPTDRAPAPTATATAPADDGIADADPSSDGPRPDDTATTRPGPDVDPAPPGPPTTTSLATGDDNAATPSGTGAPSGSLPGVEERQDRAPDPMATGDGVGPSTGGAAAPDRSRLGVDPESVGAPAIDERQDRTPGPSTVEAPAGEGEPARHDPDRDTTTTDDRTPEAPAGERAAAGWSPLGPWGRTSDPAVSGGGTGPSPDGSGWRWVVGIAAGVAVVVAVGVAGGGPSGRSDGVEPAAAQAEAGVEEAATSTPESTAGTTSTTAEAPARPPTPVLPAPRSATTVTTESPAPPPPTTAAPATAAPAATTPPPTAPPPPPPQVTSLWGILLMDAGCPAGQQRITLQYSSSGATSGRMRPEGGSWTAVDVPSGTHRACTEPGRPWQLEVANAGGSDSSTIRLGM